MLGFPGKSSLPCKERCKASGSACSSCLCIYSIAVNHFRPSSPGHSLLPNQGQLEEVAQDHIPYLDIQRDGTFLTSLGNLSQCVTM